MFVILLVIGSLESARIESFSSWLEERSSVVSRGERARVQVPCHISLGHIMLYQDV